MYRQLADAAIAEQVRVRVLRWFARSGLMEPDDVREILAWKNREFSLDAEVRVAAHNSAGLGACCPAGSAPCPSGLNNIASGRPCGRRPLLAVMETFP